MLYGFGLNSLHEPMIILDLNFIHMQFCTPINMQIHTLLNMRAPEARADLGLEGTLGIGLQGSPSRGSLGPCWPTPIQTSKVWSTGQAGPIPMELVRKGLAYKAL